MVQNHGITNFKIKSTIQNARIPKIQISTTDTITVPLYIWLTKWARTTID